MNGESDSGDAPSRSALCLSGGGYRAMLFHIGTIWRLREAGILQRIDRISSVSGGSITAAALALAWDDLGSDIAFRENFVEPLRNLAERTIDASAILSGVLPGPTVSGRVERAYRKHLFGEKTLQDLPDEPRFVINATNLQSGALWRFSKPYLRDYRVGEVKDPTVSLAKAVAASSAFPPFLSPAILKLDPEDFTSESGDDMQVEPYTRRVVLSDGGVYDNLGLETAWKIDETGIGRFKTIFVSDAGGKLGDTRRPSGFWPMQLYRVLTVIDNQVRSLRKRWFFERIAAGVNDGAFWDMRTGIDSYRTDVKLVCPLDRTMELARTPTRLAKLDSVRQDRLINWGYAASDASIRANYQDDLEPGKFPYPNSKV